MSRKRTTNKTPPTNEARPLGTKRPARVLAMRNKKESTDAKLVDTPLVPVLELPQSPITANTLAPEPEPLRSTTTMMTLTFKSISKNGKNAFYTGAAMVQRFVIKSFADGVAPATIDVADGVFAGPKPPKVAKAKLTKAERVALPKPTLAEKIARREALLARDKARLAKEAHADL